MLRSLISGISGLRSFQLGMDNIGNNIANVKTTGYKSSRVSFSDTFAQTIGSTGFENNSLKQVGSGVDVRSVQNVHQQGVLENSGVVGNVGIDGNGFFVVQNERTGEEFLTRDGGFQTDSQGFLVNDYGFRVQGYNDENLNTIGDIQIRGPEGRSVESWDVSDNGLVRIKMDDGTVSTIGQILLKNVENKDALKLEGGNLYSRSVLAGETDWNTESGRPGENALGRVRWGKLELSNVDLGNEFSNMITTQRAYQASARIITTSDEMLQEVISLKR